jgi:hypothetical protein
MDGDVLIARAEKVHAETGDYSMVGFLKGADAQDEVDAVWYSVNAEARIARKGKSRMQLLQEASQGTCCCGGLWTQLADDICQRNQVDANLVKRSIVTAVCDKTATRKNCLMICGDTTCGKTFVTNPLDGIFLSHPCPPKDSRFPLAGARLSISLVERNRTIASIRWYFAWVHLGRKNRGCIWVENRGCIWVGNRGCIWVENRGCIDFRRLPVVYPQGNGEIGEMGRYPQNPV